MSTTAASKPARVSKDQAKGIKVRSVITTFSDDEVQALRMSLDIAVASLSAFEGKWSPDPELRTRLAHMKDLAEVLHVANQARQFLETGE